MMLLSLVNRAMAAMYFHNGSASTITFLCLLIPANPSTAVLVCHGRLWFVDRRRFPYAYGR